MLRAELLKKLIQIDILSKWSSDHVALYYNFFIYILCYQRRNVSFFFPKGNIILESTLNNGEFCLHS